MKSVWHASLGIFILILVALPCRARAGESITPEELLRRTQALLDALGASSNAPWAQYYAADAMYFDEKGRSLDKATLVAEAGQLPDGYRVSFKIENTWSRIFGATAIFSYDVAEDLTIYGQQLGARFRMTDTWIQRDEKWQIAVTQAMRYYGDPAQGEADVASFSDYAGTYELAPGVRASVSFEGTTLYYQRGDRPKDALYAEVPGLFFRKGVEGRILFRHGKDGKVDALISRRNHEDILWKKVP